MKWRWVLLTFVLLVRNSWASDEDVHPDALEEVHILDMHFQPGRPDIDWDLNKDNYEDADWHPPSSLLETHADPSPDAPPETPSANGDANPGTFNQTVGSSLAPCGEYSGQLTASGQCRLVATLPPVRVGTPQQRCTDVFRCTDDISYWLNENQNRREQLEELRNSMTELQEQLRNNHHQVTTLEELRNHLHQDTTLEGQEQLRNHLLQDTTLERQEELRNHLHQDTTLEGQEELRNHLHQDTTLEGQEELRNHLHQDTTLEGQEELRNHLHQDTTLEGQEELRNYLHQDTTLERQEELRNHHHWDTTLERQEELRNHLHQDTTLEGQEELRNHLHQDTTTEGQGKDGLLVASTFELRLRHEEQRRAETDTLLHVHAELLQELQENLRPLSAAVQHISRDSGCMVAVVRTPPLLSLRDALPPGRRLSLCPSDCASLYHSGVRHSGVYTVVLSPGNAMPVYCDMETEGGGWTVFQRRRDGTVSFDRGWASYRDGFGEPRGEHWLGNRHLHRLTNQGDQSLRIHLLDWKRAHRHAQYRSFRIENEENRYRLHVSGFSGTTEDSFGRYHNLRRFSTPDTGDICAEVCHAGWWFHQCFHANLNGVYYQGGHYVLKAQNLLGPDGIVWFSWKNSDFYSLKAVTMMVRPRNFRPRSSL